MLAALTVCCQRTSRRCHLHFCCCEPNRLPCSQTALTKQRVRKIEDRMTNRMLKMKRERKWKKCKTKFCEILNLFTFTVVGVMDEWYGIAQWIFGEGRVHRLVVSRRWLTYVRQHKNCWQRYCCCFDPLSLCACHFFYFPFVVFAAALTNVRNCQLKISLLSLAYISSVRSKKKTKLFAPRSKYFEIWLTSASN